MKLTKETTEDYLNAMAARYGLGTTETAYAEAWLKQHAEIEKLKADMELQLIKKDMAETGAGFMKDGKRVPPEDVYDDGMSEPVFDEFEKLKAGAGSVRQEESPRRISKGGPSRLASAGESPVTPQACVKRLLPIETCMLCHHRRYTTTNKKWECLFQNSAPFDLMNSSNIPEWCQLEKRND